MTGREDLLQCWSSSEQQHTNQPEQTTLSLLANLQAQLTNENKSRSFQRPHLSPMHKHRFTKIRLRGLVQMEWDCVRKQQPSSTVIVASMCFFRNRSAFWGRFGGFWGVVRCWFVSVWIIWPCLIKLHASYRWSMSFFKNALENWVGQSTKTNL